MAFSFFQKIGRAIAGRSRVDDDTLDAIEEALVESDMGVDTTLKVIDNLEERVDRDKYMSQDELRAMLRQEIEALIPDTPSGPDLKGHPHIILVVGVNGVGKTTTIGKLAHYWKSQGKSVLLGAADTFRAAAVDQLDIWAERAGVEIVKQQMGSDPAAVAFDTAKAAVARGTDVVLIDTAGRLHNRIDLMNELTKIRNSRCCWCSTPAPARTPSSRRRSSPAPPISQAWLLPSSTEPQRAASWLGLATSTAFRSASSE